ncbi:MAG: thioredoxin family protein [Candidatus Bathyarchaeia archaeon]
MELKVFTLPTCPSCPVAKVIASDVAQKFGIAFKEVNLATEEGLSEGLAYDVKSTPTIVLDGEVLVRGRLVSRERLEEEVRQRIERWKERANIK